ncbi:hypothetical protein [Micromonospora tarapacensis]|nr:hypothetical protein [Micromonospora tarapacensis]
MKRRLIAILAAAALALTGVAAAGSVNSSEPTKPLADYQWCGC